MDFDALYSAKILDLAGNAPDMPRLDHPDATARKHSRHCGSVIEIDPKLGPDGRVEAYGADLDACALGQTSAAVVASNIIGATPEELRKLRDQMSAMLRDNGPPPGGKWADLKYLEPVRNYPPRHTSTMLVFDALVDALDQIDAEKTPA